MSELQALISIIDGQYRKIREIETANDILGREGDFRPRIEYYHDAIRALTSGENDPYSKYDRLAPERIAHDVSILRQIQAKPFHAGRGKQHLSTGAEISADGTNNIANKRAAGKIDRSKRNELAKLYKDYTVLYVAILADKVEDNAQLRTEDAEVLIQECAEVKDALEGLASGKISEEEIISLANEMEHEDLYMLIMSFMQSGKKNSQEIKKLINKLKALHEKLENEKEAVSQASMNFSTAQLAVYENSRDMVKKLVAQGLNIAGNFVGNAVSQEQGRGAGTGRNI